MPELSLREIPQDLREMFQKGNAALQRQNYDYAITFFEQILKRAPGFFDARQALRATQFKKAGGKTSLFKKMLGGASASPLLAKAQVQMRKNPAEALQIAEQVLNADPSNGGAHRVIADAALAADFPRTACLSLEILLKASPKDLDLNMKYGLALAAAGQVAKAEQVYTDLLRAHPDKGEIAAALKDFSARKTLREGGYDNLADGTGSYRDILRDKEQAASIEQESRTVKSDDVSGRLIAEYEARLQSEPDNMKLVRSLAELYVQKKDFDRSLAYYEQIRKSDVGNDPTLEKAIVETRLRQFDHKIAQLNPADPEQAQAREALEAERTAFQLDSCRSRAAKYPTDLEIRFELGELLFQAGQVSEAIQEFQRAQNYPAKRLLAMRYLGQCFAKRGMNDLAAKKLQEAIREKPTFDEEKKELIYQLGSVLEQMGKGEEAIEQFKLIYEQDIGYKDVEKKVNDYYSSQ